MKGFVMTKILVVEDNDLNRDMLSRRLTRRGYVVVCAICGEEALVMVREHKPDLILMDLRLPDIDGWEVTRRIKADEATRAIPVIALTAHAMEVHRDEALQAGCDDYDTKPVDLPRLLGKINGLLPAASRLQNPEPAQRQAS
jgi:CheY-like chemotaxis protein